MARAKGKAENENAQASLPNSFIPKHPCSPPHERASCEYFRVIEPGRVEKQVFERLTLCDRHRVRLTDEIRDARKRAAEFPAPARARR